MDKPISVQINEAKENIVNVINEQHLHPTILEPIIKEIYLSIQQAAIQVYEKEKKEYEESQQTK